jgi:hypothetical protein
VDPPTHSRDGLKTYLDKKQEREKQFEKDIHELRERIVQI